MDINTQINFHLMGRVIDTHEFERKESRGQPLSLTPCFQFPYVKLEVFWLDYQLS